MGAPGEDERKEDDARAVISQIWYRARINAFAHRAARDRAEDKANKDFKQETVYTLGGILFIILSYIIATEMKADGQASALRSVLMASFTLIAIILSLGAFYKTVMANYGKLDVKAERHLHAQSMYLYLAQRAREVKWTDMPAKEVEDLLRDLERDFALQKLKGIEPGDADFDAAHEIVRKIRQDNNISIAQSFQIGAVDKMAQKVGTPDVSETVDDTFQILTYGSITGIVQVDDAPAHGVIVTAVCLAGPVTHLGEVAGVCTTEDDGRFVLPDLAEGVYTLAFARHEGEDKLVRRAFVAGAEVVGNVITDIGRTALHPL